MKTKEFIKDIIVKLKDLLVDMILSYILKKLTPLIALCASRLLMETLQVYKDLLNQNGVEATEENVEIFSKTTTYIEELT